MSNTVDKGAESAKRAQAFAHLDEAKLGWFHLRAVIVSGVGFFAGKCPVALCQTQEKQGSFAYAYSLIHRH
ncbi:hypothetical protein BC830DRAFT_1159720 [Chytriomyces sp. MP71]|nr:hypothetical protein BC830DRAFT_1159720 [Chytriomyces sp. MP71]